MIISVSQALGIVENIDIKGILKNVRKRNDFQGLPFVVNYPTLAGKPYRYFDEKGNIYGLYIDILRVALKSLNLTLVIKETRPENQNIWFKK